MCMCVQLHTSWDRHTQSGKKGKEKCRTIKGHTNAPAKSQCSVREWQRLCQRCNGNVDHSILLFRFFFLWFLLAAIDAAVVFIQCYLFVLHTLELKLYALCILHDLMRLDQYRRRVFLFISIFAFQLTRFTHTKKGFFLSSFTLSHIGRSPLYLVSIIQCEFFFHSTVFFLPIPFIISLLSLILLFSLVFYICFLCAGSLGKNFIYLYSSRVKLFYALYNFMG